LDFEGVTNVCKIFIIEKLIFNMIFVSGRIGLGL